MEITRINTYDDPRFPAEVLRQHGAFLTEDGAPCAVRIVDLRTAAVDAPEAALADVIGLFRFFAGHITVFQDTRGRLLRSFPEVPLFRVPLASLQPSQFFIDEDKLAAVPTFVHASEDVVVPVVRDGERLIACDGHTRLRAAHRLGLSEVLDFLCAALTGEFPRLEGEKGHFVALVKQREALSSTEVGNQVAMPHPYGYQGKEGAAAFLTVKKPIQWKFGTVRLVILLAIPEESTEMNSLMDALTRIITDEDAVRRLCKDLSRETLETCLGEGGEA